MVFDSEKLGGCDLLCLRTWISNPRVRECEAGISWRCLFIYTKHFVDMELYFGVLCLLSLLDIAKGSLLCSVCDSVANPDCEVNPPSGTLCWQSGKGVQQSCTTIREYKINTEILLMFRRDCSTMDKGTCYNPQGQNKTLCIEVCFTDNCNAATSSVLPSYTSLLPLMLLLLHCLQ